MRVVIDRKRCMGHGRCYTVSPRLFRDNPAGYGEVIGDGRFSEAQLGDAERATRACPEQAIKIER